MTRTYGTYQWVPGNPDAQLPTRAKWVLTLEPAVRMRARRTFGRTQQTRTVELELTDSTENCRDLAWFMTRYPLEAADEQSALLLTAGEQKQLAKETSVHAALERMATATLPDGLQHTPAKTPRPYQLAAMELLRARGRFLLTDEVGLGKTFTALLNLIHTDALPALIVPPTHLPPRWVQEATDAFPWLSTMVAKKTTPPASIAAGLMPDILVVPYSKLDGWAGHLADQLRTVVFDEAQELRNGVATDKGAAAAIVAGGADYVMGLTATPIHNYGGEIWNLYDIIAPGELGSREEFAREWGKDGGAKKVADPHALGAYLREQGLMLGRTRKDVGRELPKTVKVHELVESNYEALADVAESSRKLAELVLDSTSTPQEKMQAAGKIDMEMRQATGIDKAPYVADYVRRLLESEERVVLWGWHRAVYEIWLERLKDFNPVMYTGSESPARKAASLARFVSPIEPADDVDILDPGYVEPSRLLIMSLRSGAGIDGIQEVCGVGVFGELDWSPAVHEQAIGRLRRDGMGEAPPVVYFLTSPEGSDPLILDVLGIKRQQAEPMISPDGKLLQNSINDTSRGKLLAQQILGRTQKEPS